MTGENQTQTDMKTEKEEKFDLKLKNAILSYKLAPEGSEKKKHYESLLLKWAARRIAGFLRSDKRGRFRGGVADTAANCQVLYSTRMVKEQLRLKIFVYFEHQATRDFVAEGWEFVVDEFEKAWQERKEFDSLYDYTAKSKDGKMFHLAPRMEIELPLWIFVEPIAWQYKRQIRICFFTGSDVEYIPYDSGVDNDVASKTYMELQSGKWDGCGWVY